MTTMIATIKRTPSTADKIIHNDSSESSSLRELGPTLVGESAKKSNSKKPIGRRWRAVTLLRKTETTHLLMTLVSDFLLKRVS